MPQKWVNISLRGVGIVSVVVAVGGICYTLASLFAVATGAIDQVAVVYKTPHVHAAFYVMASTCMLFYGAVFVCGVQFIRLRSSFWWLFTAILGAEVAFHFLVGWLWSHPTLGSSIAGASGISSGGLMLQFFILFPLWAPIAVWLAHRNRSRFAP